MRRVRGFTLIELMIVVAIISILAAIALPAYQDYVARAQVSEAFSLASDARTAVTVYHADRSAYPTDNLNAGLADPASITGRYVESVTVDNGNGKITVQLGNDANARIHGQQLTMQPHNPGGSLYWDCDGLSSKYLPSVCR